MGTKIPRRSYVDPHTITIEYTDHELAGSGENKYLRSVTRYKKVGINIHVNSLPLEMSVENCCDTVNNLSKAVFAFQTADVVSRKETSDSIVDAATSGFSSMIEQSLNMQSATLKADMNALAGELTAQCKELVHKRSVMQSDYNRIKNRYVGVFEDLDNELRRRILAIVKPCFDFVEQAREQQGRRIDSDLLSTATVGACETEAARIGIQATKVKSNAIKIINAAKEQIAQHFRMEQKIQEVAVEGGDSMTYYTPVMIVQTDDEHESQMHPIVNPRFRGCVKDAVESHLNELNSVELAQDECQRVENYFSDMLDTLNDGTPQSRRLIETMKQLYAKTELVKYTNQ